MFVRNYRQLSRRHKLPDSITKHLHETVERCSPCYRQANHTSAKYYWGRSRPAKFHLSGKRLKLLTSLKQETSIPGDLSCPPVFRGDVRDLYSQDSKHKVVCAENLMSDPKLLYKQYKFCEKQKELTEEFKAKVYYFISLSKNQDVSKMSKIF